MPSQVSRQIKTTIAANLRVARKAKRLTQRELAVALDTDAFQVSRWERGVVRPADATLLRMADVLDREYTWFLTEDRRAA